MQICPASFPERRNVRKGIKKADSHESRLFVSRNVVGLLLGNNAEFDRSLYIAVQFCGSLVLAEGLDCLYDDTLAVDLDALAARASARSAEVIEPKILPSSALAAITNGRLAIFSARA